MNEGSGFRVQGYEEAKRLEGLEARKRESHEAAGLNIAGLQAPRLSSVTSFFTLLIDRCFADRKPILNIL